MAQFKGSTADASSAILGASFWKKGIKIEGVVGRSFSTQNGECYEILLRTPVRVGSTLEKKVSIGNMKGMMMALNAAGLESFQTGDKVVIECTGSTGTNKGNPRIDFRIALDRPE